MLTVLNDVGYCTKAGGQEGGYSTQQTVTQLKAQEGGNAQMNNSELDICRLRREFLY